VLLVIDGTLLILGADICLMTAAWYAIDYTSGYASYRVLAPAVLIWALFGLGSLITGVVVLGRSVSWLISPVAVGGGMLWLVPVRRIRADRAARLRSGRHYGDRR